MNSFPLKSFDFFIIFCKFCSKGALNRQTPDYKKCYKV